VANYSLFAAQKLLQKRGDWEGILRMFQAFVEAKPEHPALVMAIYWIGKAQTRLGRAEEAKVYLAETVKKTIADPAKEAVEQLLSQLAQLCLRKKKITEPEPDAPAAAGEPAAATAATAVAPAPSPAPSPTPPPDPAAELDRLLGGAATEASPTAKARILFAKSELDRMKKRTAEMEAKIREIADGFRPEDLSPMLLAVVGDFLLERKEEDRAAAYFRALKNTYPECDMVDYAYNGLGEIAYRKGEYEEALALFTDAIEKVGAAAKIKEVTVGRGKSLLALGRLDEAKKVFELVAGTREWRGESTAYAVYSMGEIAEKREQWAEAIASYQRVYVAYQRYLPWVAKAYLRSAFCFEKLGKTAEARNTYQEMLRNEKLAPFPEYEEAKKHLPPGGGGGQS
jgi:TolA-binding protein